ncbi:MAG: bifunctional 5,10-methylene-tetrahydrofolate dehydrogenase/5,10-methylene-tetrahydrofolate cyclohydrolase [Candidatus Cloacimonadota bacterium]|nr:MAG: bifunctional 5,10-methylene-tetrahydrofolate dehydrogenase/5,10-methylene-tetrahydrofolate cyclohydrolase [Candidatus Cloacimonadota bacterium]
MKKRLSGKKIAKNIYASIKEDIELNNISLKLVILLIGNDPAAEYYVQNLEKKGLKIGIEIKTIILDISIDQRLLLEKIDALNNDNKVNAIMLQKPLPNHLDESEIIMKINPNKDVDAFHPLNMGNLVLDKQGFLPATPAAVLELIKYYEIETNGKHIVIVGRSDIVGKPLANLLLRKSETGNATVTVCHSRTKDLSFHTKQADILIAAIGKPLFIKSDMIKDNTIIIDVGVNQIKDVEKGYRYVGDVDYEACFEKVSSITPVPGGIGTITTAMLLNNVLFAYKIQNKN